MNGLWEYNLKTKQFKRHLVLYSDRLNTAAAVEPGHWLLSHTGRDNVVDFDLKTNQAHILLGSGFPGPELHKLGLPRQKPAFPFYKYCWQRDGYLWALDAQSLGRVSLQDGRAENLPGFAPESPVVTYCWFGMERISPTHVLVQNRAGLWALEMPPEGKTEK